MIRETERKGKGTVLPIFGVPEAGDSLKETASEGAEGVTVAELAGQWLAAKEQEVSVTTYARYRKQLETHILPFFGDREPGKLRAADIDAYVKEKMTRGNLYSGKGMAPKTVTCHLSVLKEVLRFGQQQGVTVGELSMMHAPKVKTGKELRVLTPQEQERLERCLSRHPGTVSLGILLSLYTGLLIGEVCALKWGDIAFPDRLLNVRRTVTRIPVSRMTEADGAESAGTAGNNTTAEGTGAAVSKAVQDGTEALSGSGRGRRKGKETRTVIVEGRPSSDSAIRSIPLPRGLLKLLKQEKKEDGLYILSGKDRPMEPRTYYIKYKKLLDEAGIQDCNYQALRHTFATRCVESGFDPKALSEILGHSDVSMTLKRYVNPGMEQKRKQMEEFADAVWRYKKA